MKALIITCLLLGQFSVVCSQLPWQRHEVCLNGQELRLYQMLMEHRINNGLPEIPLSVNLTWVAQIHALDLEENNPDQGGCNMHSWSDRGPWRACCYRDDHRDPHCMWDKPAEITNYQGRGYEIVFQYWPVTSKVDLPANAMQGWKGSPGHNNTILNQGIFEKARWNAIGIGIMAGYVVVWFGEEPDAEGPPPLCSGPR